MDLGDTEEHYFLCEDIEQSKHILDDLYEEDINDFVEKRAMEDEYTISGCVIILEVNKETASVENASITVRIESNDELCELEPVDIELDDTSIGVLLSKVNKE